MARASYTDHLLDAPSGERYSAGMYEKVQEYIRRAEEALAHIEGEVDPNARGAFMSMAEAWLKLAEAALSVAASTQNAHRPYRD